ncbi:hypothetical protein Tco_0943090 [Tanacetum coccineum]
MLKSLSYKRKKVSCTIISRYHLDFGLQALGNDADVMNLVRYVDKYRLIEVYIEYEYTDLDTYLKSRQKLRLEEIVEVESNALARKPFKKPSLKLNRLLQLLLEGPSLNDDVEVPSFNAEKERETTEYDDDNEVESVSESDEEAVNEAETANEANIDEDNLINEVDVDMQEFYQNIDTGVEWVGYSKSNLEVPIQMDVEEGLRALSKEHEKNSIQSKNKGGHFFVCKEFADKKDATTLVTSQAVVTRRQIYVWKNDKVRVKAVCRRKCPIFNNSFGLNASGISSLSKSNLKQVNRKWVKPKRDETSGSRQGINKVRGMRIKVGGKRAVMFMIISHALGHYKSLKRITHGQ